MTADDRATDTQTQAPTCNVHTQNMTCDVRRLPATTADHQITRPTRRALAAPPFLPIVPAANADASLTRTVEQDVDRGGGLEATCVARHICRLPARPPSLLL